MLIPDQSPWNTQPWINGSEANPTRTMSVSNGGRGYLQGQLGHVIAKKNRDWLSGEGEQLTPTLVSHRAAFQPGLGALGSLVCESQPLPLQ